MKCRACGKCGDVSLVGLCFEHNERFAHWEVNAFGDAIDVGRGLPPRALWLRRKQWLEAGAP